MLTRLLRPPTDSFFLFGPRGSGKSTLLRSWFPQALWFDLLSQKEMFELLRSPDHFAKVVEAQAPHHWIVVDEIQKAPQLLDEVHRLIETKKYRFALTGSSARKLKRGGANLLAGRAFVYHLHPLTFKETAGQASLASLLQFGSLPQVVLEKESSIKEERLRAYASTYLAEEIKAEALSRNLESFSRFLVTASLANGQVTNLSNTARDSGTSRSTVSSYFGVLVDTLLGSFLPAWQPRVRMKEVNHPKFYLFDCGVYRALTDRLGVAPSSEEKGVLFETLIFHELTCALSYGRKGGSLYYWRTQDGIEVDFIWKKADKIVAIEAKASAQWKPHFGKGLLTFKEELKGKVECLGVYLGDRRLKEKFGMVYPFPEFANLLQEGKII